MGARTAECGDLLGTVAPSQASPTTYKASPRYIRQRRDVSRATLTRAMTGECGGDLYGRRKNTPLMAPGRSSLVEDGEWPPCETLLCSFSSQLLPGRGLYGFCPGAAQPSPGLGIFRRLLSDNAGQPAQNFKGSIQWNVTDPANTTNASVDFVGDNVPGSFFYPTGRFVDLGGRGMVPLQVRGSGR